jgi:quercetin dioxygenase-like cupin family protein
VHPGDHLLLVVKGAGTVTFGGVVYPTRPGDLYMVDALTEHAVGAGSDGHWLLSFGAPHVPVDSPERMRVVEPSPAPVSH